MYLPQLLFSKCGTETASQEQAQIEEGRLQTRHGNVRIAKNEQE